MNHGILGFGESHIGALSGAAKNSDLLAELHLAPCLISLSDYTPIFQPAANGGGAFVVNKQFESKLLKEISSNPPIAIFCSIGGGDHVVIGLKHSEESPFDFFIPEAELAAFGTPPLLRTIRPVEIVPFKLILSCMRWRINGLTTFIQWLKTLTHLPIFVLSVPPPIGDDDFIKAHAGALHDIIARNGVSPRALRMKLWWLQARIQREICEENGATFLSVPTSAVDGEGFLQRKFHSGDSVHANYGYGELVFRQISQSIQQFLSEPENASL
jgi:hypothetical protein